MSAHCNALQPHLQPHFSNKITLVAMNYAYYMQPHYLIAGVTLQMYSYFAFFNKVMRLEYMA
jgi:hypothetical protein